MVVFPARVEISLFSTPTRGPTQPRNYWAIRAFSVGIKHPRKEADNSLHSAAEVRNSQIYTFTNPHAFMPSIWTTSPKIEFRRREAGSVRINATLRSVRAAIVAVDKQ